MFEAMEMWPDVVAAVTPIRNIHVSDKGRFGFSHISAEQQGVEALGYVVIKRVRGSVLQSKVAGLDGIDVLCPARIVGVELGPDSAVAMVRADNSSKTRKLSCSLLVAADGANSTVRAMLGISAQTSEYGQHAIVGNLLPEKSLNNCAFERFTSQGPLAILPVADDRAGFVWTVSEHDAQRVLALDDTDFLAEIQSEFGNRLGTFSRVGKRAAYPLVLSKAVRLTATRSVLVGNSAHGLHPVSGQGFNLGMRDVAALCDCVADELNSSASVDLGNEQLLQRYATWRHGDQNKLVTFTDNLVRIFGSARAPTRILRDIGMIGFDLIPGVRSLFAKHTMGLAGRLPRLSRGVALR